MRGRIAVFACSYALFVGTAFASAISVNGTCEFGTCAPVGTLSEGSSLSSPFSFLYTSADSDEYRLTGTVGATNSSNPDGVNTSFSLAVTYLGNNSGTVSGADTLVVDFLQNFQTPYSTGTNNTGHESFQGTFAGPVSISSSAELQIFSNGGTAMALLGPFFPPNSFSASSMNQPFAEGPLTSNDVRNTLLFGAGSGVGASISLNPTTPEPSTGFLMFGGVFLLLCCGARFVKASASR